MRFAPIGPIVAILLGGCVYYPDLYSSLSEESEAELGESRLAESIKQALVLQREYESGYQEVSKIEDILQLPVLVAAGLSGLILVEGGEFSEGSRTTRAAEIGVVAATYAAGRSALTSPAMAGYYLRGHGALNCAISIGRPFIDIESSQGYRNFNGALLGQAADIVALERLIGLTPSASQNDAEKSVLQSARTLAQTTLVAARKSRQAGLAELAAVDSIVTEFELEASQISVLVASQGQVRTNANFDAITSGFNLTEQQSAATDNKDKGLEVMGDDALAALAKQFRLNGTTRSYSHSELSNLIAAAVEKLLTSTANVEGYSPGYKTAVTQLKACSEIVTA